MIPVLLPGEMAEVDRRAPEAVDVLVARAGAAVARHARGMLGGVFGRQVVVVAGRGNNGADGRAAAAVLASFGARACVLPVEDLSPGEALPDCDLVIDAAYGTGLRRPYRPPSTGAPVLAVDIPSGLDGSTGEIPEGGGVLGARRTVTFAAWKPGLLLGEGPVLAGHVHLADIGLGALVDAAARCWLVEDGDVPRLLPCRPHDGHKWQTAVQVVAGSPGMTGAPWLVSRAAMRAGAGYVRLSVPGVPPGAFPPSEVVHLPVPEHGWHDEVLRDLARAAALVVGPGLGAEASGPSGPGSVPGGEVGQLLVGAGVPAVVDADGLNAIGSLQALAGIVSRRQRPTVITPHVGELTRLVGKAPGADHLRAARDAARASGAYVLLKGSATVVASPDGRAFVVASGSQRLATAGTGDVLSGVIGAFLARGVPPLEAAALGAHAHGRAAAGGLAEGLVASDLPDLVASWLSSLRAG